MKSYFINLYSKVSAYLANWDGFYRRKPSQDLNREGMFRRDPILKKSDEKNKILKDKRRTASLEKIIQSSTHKS